MNESRYIGKIGVRMKIQIKSPEKYGGIFSR